MIETLTNPIVLTAATAIGVLVAAAAYSYFTGNEASVDVDSDGESDVTFGGEKDQDMSNVSETPDEDPREKTENSTAEEVFDIGLTDVKGVGPSLAEELNNNGITTIADLRDATDDELLDVSGIGPSKLETIRNDLN